MQCLLSFLLSATIIAFFVIWMNLFLEQFDAKFEQNIQKAHKFEPFKLFIIVGYLSNYNLVSLLSRKLELDRRYLLEWCQALKLAGFLNHQKNPKIRLRSDGGNEENHDLFQLTDDLKDVIFKFQPLSRKILPYIHYCLSNKSKFISYLTRCL